MQFHLDFLIDCCQYQAYSTAILCVSLPHICAANCEILAILHSERALFHITITCNLPPTNDVIQQRIHLSKFATRKQLPYAL